MNKTESTTEKKPRTPTDDATSLAEQLTAKGWTRVKRDDLAALPKLHTSLPFELASFKTRVDVIPGATPRGPFYEIWKRTKGKTAAPETGK